MAAHDPLLAVGSVFDLRGARRSGTCTAFRLPQLALTAAHCVEGLEPSEVEVQYLAAPARHPALEITRHPTADIALLRLADAAGLRVIEPLTALTRIAERGREFDGFGSAEGASSFDDARSRLFAGRIRRVFADPADGHLYADLSVPVFDGYSGGPLFARDAPHALLGLITANRRRRFALRGNPGRGIALLAGEISDWIEGHVRETGLSPEPADR